MHRVNFYLKKKSASTGRALIYMKVRYDKQKLVFSFNQSIEPENWHTERQRVKANNQTTKDNKHLLNNLLDILEETCVATYNKEIVNGIPTPTVLRKALQDFLNHNTDEAKKIASTPTFFDVVDMFIAGKIQSNTRIKAVSTLKGYKTSRSCLRAFEKMEKYPITYDSINMLMFQKYVANMQARGLSRNTIAKRIRTLKCFMNEIVEGFGFSNNTAYKNKRFSVTEEPVENIYLTEDEIMRIYKHDFSDNKRLEQVQQLFIFGCLTGLRYSDYSMIKPENIIQHEGETFLSLTTKKTASSVVIPCHPIVLKIFDKYSYNSNRLPRAISGQKFNEYIKEACKLVGGSLLETGSLLSQPDVPKYQAIKSHTARRSFISNHFLAGFPVHELMQITSHKTESSFLKYVKVSKLQVAKRLNQHIRLSWREGLLKAI